MIQHRKSLFYVLDSESKKVLGKHKTLKAAKRQLAAIEASKAEAKKRG